MSEPRTILVLIDKLNVGGAERMFINHVNWFINDSNYNCIPVIITSEGDLDSDLQQTPIFLNRVRKLDIDAAKTLLSLMDSAMIVHCHSRHVYKYAKLISFLMKRKPVFILHDHFGSIEKESKLPLLYSHIIKADCYIGVCKKMVNNAHTYVYKRFLLRNAVEISTNLISGKRNEKLINIGNIKPIKNQGFAIEIANMVGIELWCIGQIQDAKYKTDISFAGVKFSHDLKSGEDALYKVKPKIGIHTAISESGPLVLAEYAATGTPFVAYNTGDIAGLFALHVPELILSNFEPENWIEVINLILDDYEYYQSKVREVYTKYLTPSVFSYSLREIYSNLE